VAVQRGHNLDHDFDSIPLEIKTDSLIGSGDILYLALENEAGWYSAVRISFNSPPQYYLLDCTNSWNYFPTSLPTAKDKVWRITKTRTSGIRLRIHCNEKEVLNILMSDSTCSYSNWRRDWTSDNIRIYFNSDTASDFYRPYSAGELINDILVTKDKAVKFALNEFNSNISTGTTVFFKKCGNRK
jgi:hypothetical protein